MKTKKSKFLKAFGFSSLALLMGIAGTMAFAPLGANPNNLAGASEMVDQINTKADGKNIKYAPSALGLDPENDPIIYTTESGLEIKYGGVNTSLGGGDESFTELSSSTISSERPLAGYPYITMGTYSGYAVNWVIVAKSSTLVIQDYQKLSYYQTNKSYSGTYTNFFDNTYEETTPAGSALKTDNLLNNVCARTLKNISSLLSGVTPITGISGNTVLCFTECVLGTSRWSSADAGGCDMLNTTTNNRYNTDLGLTTAQKNAMTTKTHVAYSGTYGVTTYLTTNALRVAYTIGTTTGQVYWTNQAWEKYTAYAITAAGAHYNNSSESNTGRDNCTYGVRLACVVRLSA